MLAKFSTALNYFQVAWNVLSEVKVLIELFEEADPDDGQKHGPEKKKAVLDLVETVYDVGEKTFDLPIEKETILQLADNAIEVFVNVFNVIGRFRSKSK